MFYAHFVLSKKGPLARIWLAAHWDKKLTKAHVFETNIESSVEGILQPKVKMALRTSGHLLLGVVRIYSRKAKYLLADCNEAFIKIKMAFRPGVVDLPEENREAAVATITLPEVFHDFDTAMPDLNDIDVQAQFTLNQSRAEEITMREDYGNITLVGDDGFGDMGFEDAEIVREASNMEETLEHASLLFGDSKKDKEDNNTIASSRVSNQSVIDKHVDMELDAPLRDDGFGGGVGEGLLSAETGGLFEPGGLFDDAPMEHVPIDNSVTEPILPSKPARLEEKKHNESDDDDDYYDMGPPSMGAPSSGPSSPASPLPPIDNVSVDQNQHPTPEVPPAAADQTTLIQNEEETFALAPLDTITVLGTEKSKAKRKRKLIVDEVKNISGEEMKAQLSDTSDIVTTLDLAPPTKRLMHWKETGGVEKLFALPGRPIPSRTLSKLYQRHLTTRAVENEDFGLAAEEEKMDLEAENQRDELNQINEGQRLLRKRHLEPDTDHIEPIALETTLPPHELTQALPEEPLVPFQIPLEQTQMPPPQMPSAIEDEHQLPNDVNEEISSLLPPLTSTQQLISPQQPAVQEVPKKLPKQMDSQQMTSNSQTSQVQIEHSSNQTSVLPDQAPTTIDESRTLVDNNEPVPVSRLDESLLNEENPLSVFDQHNENYLNELRPQPTPYMPEEDDDMECPASVGPPDEQGADETYEQFEERVLTKRAQQMLHVVKHKLDREEEIRFSELVKLNNRKQVAQKFYTFLVLKKQQAVELHQDQAFSELIITRGPKLEMVC